MTNHPRQTKPPIAISMGDPAGIGPETIVQLFRDHPDEVQSCVVYGDAAHMERARALIAPHSDFDMPVIQVAIDPAEASGCVAWGQVDLHAGRLAAASIVGATQAVLRGECAALLTAPIHKEALHAAGFNFPGHTEFLQSLCAEHLKISIEQLPVRMMLANAELRTVLHSIHVSLREALDRIEAESLWETLMITHKALSYILGRPPRIAVAGVNPHAGEGGKFGREEIDVIAPTIARARAAGWQISGPYPPDTVFMRARQLFLEQKEGFDAVLAMYHDQGLIPVKYLGVEHGVNITLGLPIVRTSPDHGTAFDIAGTGKASAASLLAALRMARKMALATQQVV